MPPIKQQIAQIEWFKVAATAITTALMVTGLGWALIEQRGDNRWASKGAFDDAAKQLIVVNTQVIEHHKNTDLHMSMAAKDATYVRRDEWNNGRAELKSDIADLKTLATEQRSLSIEILKRLPTQ